MDNNILDNNNVLNYKRNVKNRADSALFWAAMLFFTCAFIDYYFSTKLPPVFAIMLKLIKGTSVAALIGGIADWYGVTAIFGKPLHISYKTEIAITRKDSFIESIKDFIGDDILSEENVRLGFERLELTDRLLDLLEEEKGKPEGLVRILSDFLAKISLGIINKIEAEKISGFIKSSLLDQFQDKKPSDILIRMLGVVGENRNFEKALSKSASELEGIVNLKVVKDIIERAIDMAILSYRGKAKGRGFVADIVEVRIKKAIFENIESSLAAFKKMDSAETKKLKIAFLELIKDLETNDSLLKKIDDTILNYIRGNNFIDEKLKEFIEGINSDKNVSEEKLSKYILMAINYLLDAILKDSKLLEKFEVVISEYLIKLLNKNRESIKELVDKNLRVMPERELIDFLRVNTENELQYIRLNGMLFGTLIGFVVTAFKLIVGIS